MESNSRNEHDGNKRVDDSSSESPNEAGKPEDRPVENSGGDNDLEFVVTEAHGEGREFVGGKDEFDNEKRPNEPDDERTDLDDFNRDQNQPTRPRVHHSEPIGMSEPPPPPGAVEDDRYASTAPINQASGQVNPDSEDQNTANGTGQIKKLSEAEVRSIREKMYGESNGLSDSEKKQLISSTNEAKRKLFDNEPIVPPRRTERQEPAEPAKTSPESSPHPPRPSAPSPQPESTPVTKQPPPTNPAPRPTPPKPQSGEAPNSAGPSSRPRTTNKEPVSPHRKATVKTTDLPKPQMAPPEKGLAYYFKNVVQLVGRHEIHEGSTLVLDDRYYELRRKTIDPKILYGSIGVAALVILMIIGAVFVSDPSQSGQLMGMVLDTDNKPYIRTASIRFPDLGKTISSNPQGFFNLGDVPEGSYKIEYIIGEEIVGEDFATVVGGEVTLVALRPGTIVDDGSEDLAADESPSDEISQVSGAVQSSPPDGSRTTPSPKIQTQPQQPAQPTRASTSPGVLKLSANIEGAKIEIDGRILGAGNLAYPKIKPGRRKYSVTADGYDEESGYVDIAPGRTTVLEVELSPLELADKVESFTPEQFYYSGMNALKEGRHEDAIADFTLALDKDPGSADAYSGRAEAYYSSGEMNSAHNDFIRSAEIYTVQKAYGQAATAYNRALQVDPESIVAYLGRGNLYLIKGQEIAAITDFDAAREIDDENPQAYLGLGKARFNQRNYKKAIEHLKDARKHDQSNPVTYQYLMLSYFAVDKMDDVQDNYEQFTKVASPQQLERLDQDSRFSAVLRVVDNDK